jgi:endo-1,4-beta-D-glucanase Y
MTVLHITAESCEVQVFQEIFKWAKENLTTDKINKLLLSTVYKRRTGLHITAEFCEGEVFHEIFNWAKENLTTDEINKLLLVTDYMRRTVKHGSKVP